MAVGDVNYNWVQSGSTATSDGNLHNLFGGYGGLSDLNRNDILHLQVLARGEFAYLGPSSVQVSNNFGAVVDPAASTVDFPPMKRTLLETFQFARGSATDSTVYWTIWKRNAL